MFQDHDYLRLELFIDLIELQFLISYILPSCLVFVITFDKCTKLQTIEPLGSQ